jgi:hypothetical protein
VSGEVIAVLLVGCGVLGVGIWAADAVAHSRHPAAVIARGLWDLIAVLARAVCAVCRVVFGFVWKEVIGWSPLWISSRR